MTVYYGEIRVLIDPEQSDPLKDGGRLQDVSVILTARHSVGLDQPPAAITLLACQARELAFELLEQAEVADRMRTQP
jgi:hypothetical protein